MARGRRINVIYSDNSSGLSRDAWVVREALERIGHRVWLTPRRPRPFPLAVNYAPEIARHALRSATQRVLQACAKRTGLWDVNIFLDTLVPEYFDSARINCVVPNQEWFESNDRRLLKDIDLVLFKTRHAMNLLQAEAKHSAYVGFTSLDRLDRGTASRHDAALHVCGWNPHKGTGAVINAWSNHPEWPELTVVTQLANPSSTNRNVTHVTTRIADARLRRLQNQCAVHVCPSEVEGFGHTLMEALSCGAILVTTDAPPMDELVSPEEGFLVPHARSTPMRAGTRYFVDERHLTEVMARIWSMERSALDRVRRAARAKFESGRAFFRRRLVHALQDI
jgi:glycosyltransferase involved in cell wall biosynthesis